MNGLPVFVLRAQVGDIELNSLVQVSQFAQARGQRLIIVFGDRKDRTVGFEGDDRSVIVLGRLADDFHGSLRNALAEVFPEDFSSAVHFGDQQRGERIHAGHADAVQTARHLITVLVELTAGMQHRKHHFEGGTPFLLVHIGRNTAPVVLNGDRVVLVDENVDAGTVPGQRLVDRVVDHFVHQMVQPPDSDVPDIHRGALAHRLEALEHLNAGSGVRLPGLLDLIFFLYAHIFFLSINLLCQKVAGQNRSGRTDPAPAHGIPAHRNARNDSNKDSHFSAKFQGSNGDQSRPLFPDENAAYGTDTAGYC